MTIHTLTPYLNLGGNAEKAIHLYESALGAKVEQLMRFRDMPGGCETAESAMDKIMHAQLRIGSAVLMLSDGRPSDPPPPAGNISVNIGFASEDGMASAFERLSEGGTITVGLHDAFWGAKFGMVIDRFGIHWMMNCDQSQR